MLTIEDIVEKFNSNLNNLQLGPMPKSLYDPVYHILSKGGKRIRPGLLLASYHLFEENIEPAMDAAIALEVFHNFTLVHDDIMDDAPIRRGIETVHKKFSTNSAILSGDVMMLLVYRFFSKYAGPSYHTLIQHFTEAAIKICEGQQMDMDFESSEKVSIEDYLKMIEYKTAVLLGEALFMGALLAGSSEKDRNHLLNFGINMGIAFQLQDDLLDCYGMTGSVGKKIGGDIVQGKKTYLFLKTRELLSLEDRKLLDNLMTDRNKLDENQKIKSVLTFYQEVNVKEYTIQLIEAYTLLAISHLDALSMDGNKLKILRDLASSLMTRAH